MLSICNSHRQSSHAGTIPVSHICSLLVFCLIGALLNTFAAEDPGATRAAFLKIIAQPKVALEPVVRSLAASHLTTIHFTFQSTTSERVPGLLVKAEKSPGRRPVVVVLHGTGGRKEGQAALLRHLATMGFGAVAIDGRHHGERTKAGSGSAEYVAAIRDAYRSGQGHPFLYDTVWDVVRLVDYLETRDDVDARRIGLIGFSKGGMETYLAAAADPRIAVAVPCIGVQSFRWALDHDSWHSRIETIQGAVDQAARDEQVSPITTDFIRRFYDRVVPGIYEQFDGPAMLPLIAPRPLLVINGDSDARTPVPGVEECADAARSAYRRLSSEDHFQLVLQKDTGHKVNPAAQDTALQWFKQWLKP